MENHWAKKKAQPRCASVLGLVCHSVQECRQCLALFGGQALDLAQQAVFGGIRFSGHVKEGFHGQAQLTADQREVLHRDAFLAQLYSAQKALGDPAAVGQPVGGPSLGLPQLFDAVADIHCHPSLYAPTVTKRECDVYIFIDTWYSYSENSVNFCRYKDSNRQNLSRTARRKGEKQAFPKKFRRFFQNDTQCPPDLV